MEQVNEAIVKTVETESPQKKGKKGWIVLLILAVLLVGAYAGLCAYANSLNTFYPNYHINGIDMSGLTVEQAQEKLETQLLAQGIEITNHTLDTQLTISVSDLGYTAESFAGDAAFWMEQEQNTAFLLKGWEYLCYWTGRYPGGYHWPDMEQETLNGTCADVAAFFSQEPVDGSYELEQGNIFVTCARDGRAVEAEAVCAALADITAYSKNGYRVELTWEQLPAAVVTAQDIHNELAGEVKNAAYDKEVEGITVEQVGVSFDPVAVQKQLDAAQPGETVKITAQVEYPTVTAEELEKVLFRDVLGECRTHVSGTAARINNVKLSAATINGYVMNSGEVFSYNEAVGQRTAANGYQAAPAYIRGETVDEIGGGICQTSSTLYLACLRGDLEITERYAHRYVPAYIPWGMDATVSWGGPDYKFTNQTDYPIKIVTEYSKNYLTVKVLGTNVDGRYAKVTNEVLSTTPWTTVYEEDSTMTPGMPEKEKTSPYTGYKVKTYHTIYDAEGKVIDSHYEATSDYKVRNKVILRAPAAVPVPDVPAAGTVEIPAITPETPVEPEVPVEPVVPAVGEELLPGTEPVTPEGAL